MRCCFFDGLERALGLLLTLPGLKGVALVVYAEGFGERCMLSCLR